MRALRPTLIALVLASSIACSDRVPPETPETPETVLLPARSDRDRDTLADSVDGCPDDAEDIDLFQDDDGCPERDNDGDAIIDINDLCPNDAESFDGQKDDDGCPEPGATVARPPLVVPSER